MRASHAPAIVRAGKPGGIASLILVCSSCAHSEHDVACQAVAAYLQRDLATASANGIAFAPEQSGNPIAGSDGAQWAHVRWEISGPPFATRPRWVDPLPTTTAEIRLIKKIAAQPAVQNAVTVCAEVRDLLKSKSILFDESEVRRVSAVFHHNLDRHLKTIAVVQMPVLSDDRKSAILVDSRYGGPLSGGGWFVKLERQPDGTWTATRSALAFVS